MTNSLPVAQITGAVNTVVNENGIFVGHTTDGIGYMESVKEAGLNIIGEKITVLGAGGAATSIIAQAAFDGVSEISIFNQKSKSYERMEGIISQLTEQTNCKLNLFTYDSQDILRKELAESILLVNTTPGRHGAEYRRQSDYRYHDVSFKAYGIRYHLQSRRDEAPSVGQRDRVQNLQRTSYASLSRSCGIQTLDRTRDAN